MLGLGLDIVELDEFDDSIARRPRTLAQVFTRAELSYCRARAKPVQHPTSSSSPR